MGRVGASMASESSFACDFHFVLRSFRAAWWFLHNWDTTAIGTSFHSQEVRKCCEVVAQQWRLVFAGLFVYLIPVEVVLGRVQSGCLMSIASLSSPVESAFSLVGDALLASASSSE